MEQTSSSVPAAEPAAEYARRLEKEQSAQAQLDRRHYALGTSKLCAAGLAVGLLVWSLTSHGSLIWLATPVAAFIALEAAHTSVLRRLQRSTRVVTFYQRAIARLENRWMGSGETGDRFLDEAHPYARDLDIFGKGSLFEFLCTARTGAGQEILARWLLAPAPLDEIRARQAAVTELRPRLDLREELAVAGEDVRSEVRPSALMAWAEAPSSASPAVVRAVAGVLGAVWLVAVALWLVRGLSWVAVAATFVNLAFFSWLLPRIRKIVPAEQFARDLALLAGVLGRLERETFSSPRLISLQGALRTNGPSPAGSLSRAAHLMQSLESRRNIVVAALDPFVFWTPQLALAIESWRVRFGRSMRVWLDAVGEMEALMSLAGYAFEHPADVFPEFVEPAPLFEARSLAHPLLPEHTAVPNDLSIGAPLRLMVISGPNMAGKSTFVRAVGVNAVLAQCGAPVRAQSLRMSRLQVAASICILDSLQGGVSRFYAEINRLKLIAELTRGPLAVLFLLDELLSGTNSNDRRAGAEAVLKTLVDRGAVGFVTTHDLALTRIAENGSARAANFHFDDRIENGELHFDYRIVPGVAQSSNALALMRSIGLDV